MFVKYLFPCQGVRVRTMVLNATFNNISATVYRGGQFLVGWNGVPGGTHRPATGITKVQWDYELTVKGTHKKLKF
jgi:hypothetical protein